MVTSPFQIDLANQFSILNNYIELVIPTDKLPKNDLKPVLMGIFGEVGSIMTTAKKLHREKEAYLEFRHAVVEEFGDTLWYLTTLCNRLGFNVQDIFIDALKLTENVIAIDVNELLSNSNSYKISSENLQMIDETLLKMGEATIGLLQVRNANDKTLDMIKNFAFCFLKSLQIEQISFTEVVSKNIEKVSGRFMNRI